MSRQHRVFLPATGQSDSCCHSGQAGPEESHDVPEHPLFLLLDDAVLRQFCQHSVHSQLHHGPRSVVRTVIRSRDHRIRINYKIIHKQFVIVASIHLEAIEYT